MRLFWCVLGFIGFVGHGHGALITTLFATNNQGNAGGGVYFNINVLNPNGISINALAVNTSFLAEPISLSVYTRSGTAQGFEQSLVGWSFSSSGTGTGAGLNNPSTIDVVDFVLPQGLWGIALDAVNFDHRYTNGDGSPTFGDGGNQIYSNADLQLLLGSAMNLPFSPLQGVFSPRVFNGTIFYDVVGTAVPEPHSLALLGLAWGALVLTRKRRPARVA